MKLSPKTIQLLSSGGIGILPTDTIYGLVGQALSSKAVERVYEARRRRPDKPCIILVADISDLSLFGITINQLTNQLISRFWPGPVSVVLPCNKPEFLYLHRDTKTLAFRLPADENLRSLLRQTGPLIAPSANPEGQKPATTVGQAKIYFDDTVDFYEDAGELISAPSTLVSIENGEIKVLRHGAHSLPGAAL